ncbi:hypothetical protein DAETH_19170 [Deinococcus aetherius]|uniref:Uncharacterized protein n=1 Tax=Deinococcus aetherius TaxID=200252 RepID=A0ABN6RIX5_9DEIO|nr:hypothetical protein [Deinococcus aetherius]BDP41948.1 hypothetical protein DAETH_19170 [Deinococcus aetherius]
MTQSGAPTPPLPPLNEAEYARKLALAILSTLQTKGLLSAAEVDAILIAARRAAQGQGTPAAPSTPPAQVPDARPAPAPFQVTVQPSPPPSSLSWHTTPPPAEKADRGKEQADEKVPPVIDMQLD